MRSRIEVPFVKGFGAGVRGAGLGGGWRLDDVGEVCTTQTVHFATLIFLVTSGLATYFHVGLLVGYEMYKVRYIYSPLFLPLSPFFPAWQSSRR